MAEELSTSNMKQKTEDRFTRKDSRLYTNFDLLATKHPKGSNKVVFVIIIGLILLASSYLASFYL